MIIDTHCHIMDESYSHELFWAQQGFFFGKEMGRIAGKVLDSDQVRKTQIPKWWDPTGKIQLALMDRAGIDRAILLGEDLGVLWGEGEKSVEQQHEEIAGVCRKYPERFLFCPQVDPQRPNGLELIEKCVTEYGAGAVKLYPITGFAPDDNLVWPLIGKMANTWKIPLIVHIGAEPPPVRSQGAHPCHLERALRDYPSLTILACHMGLIWWRELLALGKRYTNLVTDISGWQPTIVGTYGRFCHVVRRFLDEWGAERVLFGTDIPAFEDILPTYKYVEIVKDLPRKAPEGMKFTDAEIKAILGDNAERIFFPKTKKVAKKK